MRTSGADWAAARALCPTEEYRSEDWHSHFTDQPDVLMQMLGDIFRVYKSEQAKVAGTSNPQGGRRRNHIDGSIDELLDITAPKFSNDPFPTALWELLGTRSIRWLAMRIGMDQGLLTRKVNGKRPVDRFDLERIADALRVHPAYFREWRIEVCSQMVTTVLTAHPNRSIGLLKVSRLT